MEPYGSGVKNSALPFVLGSANARPRDKLSALGLFIGFVVSLFIAVLVYQVELEHAAQERSINMVRFSTTLEREFLVRLEAIHDIEGLFNASNAVEFKEFNIMAQGPLSRHPAIQALEWVQAVPNAQREEFEQARRADVSADFRIRPFNRQDMNAETWKSQDYYLPIIYLAPLKGNEAALGIDLLSEPARKDVIERAKETQKLVISDPLILAQEQGNSVSFVGAVQLRNDKGFSLGVLRVNDIIARTWQASGLDETTFPVRLVDVTPNRKQAQIYGPKIDGLSGLSGYDLPEIGGRKWRLEALSPLSVSLVLRISIFILSWTLCFFVTNFVQSKISRTRRIEELVRTKSKELVISDTRMKTILETMATGLIGVDQKGRIVQLNRAAQRIFHVEPKRIANGKITDLIPEWNSLIEGLREECLENGAAGCRREMQSMGRFGYGESFPAEIIIGMTEEDSGPLYVASVTDITERHQAQRALVNAWETAQSANQAKTEFLNVISHELRTPLTVVLGYISVLSNANMGMDLKKVADIATRMGTSGRHLMRLIDDLIDVSKIEAGRLTLEVKDVEAVNLLRDVEGAFGAEIRSKGVDFFLETDEGLTIHGDGTRLRQILFNLVENAAKFTKKGFVRVNISRHKDKALFEVIDTGCGIDDRIQHQIFDAFAQGDSSRTRKAGGLGIGLAICANLVKLHGSSLQLESNVGKGSRFSFEIALAHRVHSAAE